MGDKRQFGRGQDAVRTNRRRSQRDKLGIAVSMYSISQSRVVTMLDVSRTGARIAAHSLPQTGKDVLLKVADIELFGRLVRTGPGEAGMEFERPIGLQVLEKLQAALAEQRQEALLYSE